MKYENFILAKRIRQYEIRYIHKTFSADRERERNEIIKSCLATLFATIDLENKNND